MGGTILTLEHENDSLRCHGLGSLSLLFPIMTLTSFSLYSYCCFLSQMDNFLLLTCCYLFPFSFMHTGTNKDIYSHWMFSSLTWLLKKVGPISTLAFSFGVLHSLLCSDNMSTWCTMTLLDSLSMTMKKFCRNYLPTQHHSELFCGRSVTFLLWHLLWSGYGIGDAVLILTDTRQCCFAFSVP